MFLSVRMMISKDDGEIENEGESNNEFMPLLEDASDVEYLFYREFFVAIRVFRVQIKEDEKLKCENIFHARCHVNNVCSMIIDRRSCTSVTSTSLVEKLSLITLKHYRPCKLNWLNDC